MMVMVCINMGLSIVYLVRTALAVV